MIHDLFRIAKRGSLWALLASGCAPEWIQHHGVEILVTRTAEGAAPEIGTWVALHYEAFLEDGTRVDSSRSREAAWVVAWGSEAMIPGLRAGLEGMRVGEERSIRIPPELGYGSIGKQRIPPDAVLRYDVELIEPFEVTRSGLQVRSLGAAGEGPSPADGDVVVLEYTVMLPSLGRELASSKRNTSPLEFVVGSDRALAGLDEGVRRMTVGSRAQLVVPPEIGFGMEGLSPQLRDPEELLFECHLLAIRPKRAP